MTSSAGIQMDRIYRHQRHIYDFSRKFFLLGRDRAIAELAARPGETVCEIGCGTARNLIRLARRYPEARFCGIDASAAMLATARRAVARAGLAQRIRLRQGLAESLDPERDFGLAGGFDAILLSYTLSMIPPWQAVLHRAIRVLAPGGRLLVVDFHTQDALPGWFRWTLRRWLARFSVEPRSEAIEFLTRQARTQAAALSVRSLYHDYAFVVTYRLPVGA